MVKINYHGNYLIHAMKNGKQISLNGGEKNVELDRLPEDMTWVEVLEPIKVGKTSKTGKKVKE